MRIKNGRANGNVVSLKPVCLVRLAAMGLAGWIGRWGVGRFGSAGWDPRTVLFQTPETVRISLSENVARVPNQLTDKVIFIDSIGSFSLTGATSRPLTSLFYSW